MISHQQSLKASFKFAGTCASSIAVDDVLGPSALAYIEREFSYLFGKNLYLNARRKSDAPYTSFLTEYFHAKIHAGYVPRGCILDLASTHVSNLFRLQAGETFANRIHTKCPLNTPIAQLRNRQETNYISLHDAPKAWEYATQCQCTDFTPKMCACHLVDFDAVIAIGVAREEQIKEMAYHLSRKNTRQGYFSLFDVDHVRRTGRSNALGFDAEIEVQIREDDYKLRIQGSALASINHIIQTRPEAWQFTHDGQWYLCEIVQTLDHGDIPCRLVRMSLLGDLPLEEVQILPIRYMRPIEQRVVHSIAYPEIEKPKKIESPKAFLAKLETYYGDMLESVSEQNGVITLRIREKLGWTNFSVRYVVKTYIADMDQVIALIPSFIGRLTPSDATRQTRVYIQQQIEKTGAKTLADIEKCVGSVVVAMHIAARVSSEVVIRNNTSEAVSRFRAGMNGLIEKVPSFTSLHFDITSFIGVFLKLLFVACIIWGLGNLIPGTFAKDESDSSWFGFSIIPLVIVIFVVSSLTSVKRRLPPPGLKTTLEGACVFDDDRLNPVTLLGRLMPKWKFRSPDWKFENLICDAKEKVAAHRIAPNFNYPNYSEPTVKHNCRKVVMAAALRACSNKVYFEDAVMLDFTRWFKSTVIDEYMRALDGESVHVTLEGWLAKYPVKYREEVLRELNRDWEDTRHFVYESFPKVELQFTDVPLELAFTRYNACKERQISGPPTAKKLCANAFINALEGLAHRHIPTYCGMKNWGDICHSVDSYMDRIPNILFGAADGSGFDMTQFIPMHKLVDELVEKCLNHVNFTCDLPLNKKLCLMAMRDSHVLDVSVGRGAVSYKAEGRASGDGWTTFGNTVLMSAYWRYCFHKAKIDDYMLFVKGDDVLFGLRDWQVPQLNVWIDRLFLKKQEFKSHGLGQICKFVKFGKIEEMDFLSNYFFRANNGKLRMTRIPARVVQSICWSTKVPAGLINPAGLLEVKRQLCYSKGMSLLAWATGLPIFEEMGHMMVRLGKPGKHIDYNEYADKDRVWNPTNDRVAYEDFLSFRFNFPIETIASIEKKFREAKTIEDVIEVAEFSNFFTQ
jgi:hypothetical protein